MLLLISEAVGFPGGSGVKSPPVGWDRRAGRPAAGGVACSPGSRLENPMDRGAWWAVHGVAKSRTRLSNSIVSVVFLVHLPPPTSSCPLSSSTHHANAHPHICIFEQPKAPDFAMLMQIKEGGRKHVETSKATMFKLERQKTTAQRKRIDKEERIEYSRIE